MTSAPRPPIPQPSRCRDRWVRLVSSLTAIDSSEAASDPSPFLKLSLRFRSSLVKVPSSLIADASSLTPSLVIPVPATAMDKCSVWYGRSCTTSASCLIPAGVNSTPDDTTNDTWRTVAVSLSARTSVSTGPSSRSAPWRRNSMDCSALRELRPRARSGAGPGRTPFWKGPRMLIWRTSSATGASASNACLGLGPLLLHSTELRSPGRVHPTQ
mmetsp:Transcript_22018/g.49614  ORF Transcript_22018/g.49614 Transcript_22018/m.49614 type:complete len:213 (+) Transcript_22018:538-1176(+)